MVFLTVPKIERGHRNLSFASTEEPPWQQAYRNAPKFPDMMTYGNVRCAVSSRELSIQDHGEN